VALSTTEAEFIAISEGLRSTILLIGLVKEFRDKGVLMLLCQPKIHCRVFEDNNGALELVRTTKFRPRTKHINVKYWQFVDHVMQHNIEILPVDTKEQLAYIFTKPLPKDMFEGLRGGIQGKDWKNGTILPVKQGSVYRDTSYMRTDLKWEFKAFVFRQHCKVAHCTI